MDIGLSYAVLLQVLSPSLISKSVEGAATMPEDEDREEREGSRPTREEVWTKQARKQKYFYGIFSDN